MNYNDAKLRWIKGRECKQLEFYCQACDKRHVISVGNPTGVNGPVALWNTNYHNPSFKGNFKHTNRIWNDETQAYDEVVCHYEIKNGEISFLATSGHIFAGTTQPMRLAGELDVSR